MKKLILIFMLFLESCTKEDPTIVGHHYQLQSNDPIDITLDFHPDGHFSGRAVNNYYGIYKIDGTNIQMTLQANTTRLDTKSHLSIENDYFQDLKTIRQFELDKSTLTLIGENKRLQFSKLNSD